MQLVSPYMQLIALVGAFLGAIVMLAWRVRETNSPVTAKKILIPPLGMSTGFSMFFFPPTRIPLAWGLGAFLLGALVFSYPLIHSSKLTRRGDAIILQRSKAFLWVLIGLFAVRLAMRGYVEHFVDTMQTGALFFVLAFGMIVPWRVGMFVQYRRLRREAQAEGGGVLAVELAPPPSLPA